METSMATHYLFKHCSNKLIKNAILSLWKISRNVAVDVIGSERIPEKSSRDNLVRYKNPSLVFFDKCPSVGTRERARDWYTLSREQTGWTNYVFGRDYLFPKNQPLVLVSPPPESLSYAQHAQMLAPDPPLICLAHADDVGKAASLVGTLVFDDQVQAEDAAAALSNKTLSFDIGDGHAALWIKNNTKKIVAVVGNDHLMATHVYMKALDRLRSTIQNDNDAISSIFTNYKVDGDENDATRLETLVKYLIDSKVLEPADLKVLNSHHIYHLDPVPSATFPLAIVGGR